MISKLKRDQIPQRKVENWRKNFNDEKSLSFNLLIPQIIRQKETYKILHDEDENRVRIYLGLEEEKQNRKHVLCAFAVSALLLGSGEVCGDYETPVSKLTPKNEDYLQKTNEVIESIRRYKKWLSGELFTDNEWAAFRQYIYPNAILFTKIELHEIFKNQNKSETQIVFGFAKTMNMMVYSTATESRSDSDDVRFLITAVFVRPIATKKVFIIPS